MLNDATDYLKRGFAVLVLARGSKIPPAKREGEEGGVKLATKDPIRLKELLDREPGANIGIALGEPSRVVAIDLDGNHGATEEDFKRFPRTVTVKTRNGYHLYFKMPAGGVKSHVVLASPNGDKAGAAYLRSTGYYVVAPPSVVVHDDGQEWEYCWHSDAGGELSFAECPLAELPEWCLDKKKASYGPNSRHDMFQRTATQMRKRGESAEKIEAELHKRNQRDCNPPKENCDEEIRRIVDWVMQNVQVDPTASGAGRPPKEPVYLIAMAFLDDEFPGGILKYYKQDFYQYTGTHYKRLDDEELEARLTDWLVATGRLDVAGSDKMSGIIKCLKAGERFVPSEITLPALNGRECRQFIPLQNGLFNIERYVSAGQVELEPHTSEFFCTYCLPYEFREGALCPGYDAVVDFTFGDEELKGLWDEILGVHLYQPFPLEHFFVLQGEGANGKSVLMNVLINLLGEQNVSSVPLECFHPKDFSFTETYGKLANIVADQHDIDDINEGLLKQFVTREMMTFNRKFKSAFTAKPTAFLTVCTNSLPNFSDKSDGLWRRMVLFQLQNQVAEGDRNPKLLERGYWLQEMPGIFNRALAGLMRVVRSGRLSSPSRIRESQAEYREDLDNVAQFDADCLVAVKGGSETSVGVYRTYCAYTKQMGQHPVAMKKFYRRLKTEFLRRGHKVEMSKVRRQDNYVGRFIEGVQYSELGKQFVGAYLEPEFPR